MSGAVAGPCDAGVAAAALPHPRATLAATVLGSSVAFIDGSVVNVALPGYLAWAYVPETKDARGAMSLDWGAMLATLSLALLTWSLTAASEAEAAAYPPLGGRCGRARDAGRVSVAGS